jgi:hypothetical protein
MYLLGLSRGGWAGSVGLVSQLRVSDVVLHYTSISWTIKDARGRCAKV